MAALVEIRVPTFRRPAWLRHALGSIREQTLGDWCALVFDDSPGREGEAIVRELSDPRIEYHWNQRSLGATGNLNKAFQTEAYVGARYACVVEDDNWVLPGYLEENVDAIRASGCAILHRNQQIWDRSQDPPKATSRTTLGDWYPPGRISAPELRAYTMLFPGISNGALFWSTEARSNLWVDDRILDASLQEYCRCLQIVEDSFFAPECNAIWADVPIAKSRRPYYSSRQFGRFLQHIRRQVIEQHGGALLENGEAVARRRSEFEMFERNLFNALVFKTKRRSLSLPSFLAAVGRATVKQVFVENPAPWYRVPLVA